MKLRSLFPALLFALLSLNAMADGSLMTVETETFDGEDFDFPADLSGKPLNVLFLAMGKDRDNGQLQQEQLMAWQQAIDESGGLPEGVECYHFPVMESPPFFVKGIIRKAMSESYEKAVPLNRAGLFYIDDLQAFADSAGLDVDARPTIVIATADGKVLKQLKGEVDDDKLAELRASLTNLSAAKP